MGKPEGTIERYLSKSVKQVGGIDFKFVSPTSAGVPDRIVIHNGHIVFVEVKAPGEKTRPLQEVIARRIRTHGGRVYVVDTKQSVDEFIEEMISWPAQTV